jgi:hypothetical protein
MGAAVEIVGGFVTNAGATLTALTASPGDSFTVRNHPDGGAAWLDQVIADFATAGDVRIFSPRMHDQVNGIRFTSPAAQSFAALPDVAMQRVYPQDALTVQATSGGADSTAVALILCYEDLPGIEPRLATWDEIAPRVEDLFSNRNGFNSSGTIGTWAGEAINADADNFIANRDYAILGYTVDVNVTAVAYRGADTGNVRIGGPGTNSKLETRDWFVRQAASKGRPYIPVINSANRAGVTVEVIDNAATTATVVTTHYALLKP